MKIANAKTFGGERYLVESDIEEFVLSSDVRLIVEEAIESAVVNVSIDSAITSDGLNPVAGSAIYAALGEKVGMSEFEALAGSVVSSAVGKQLSEEDFTSALKDKLESVASGATYVVDSTVADWGYTKITSANVNAIVSTIAYAKNEVYTKDEVDNRVVGVYRYKSSVDNYSLLPGSSAVLVGDVYNIVSADSTHSIKSGDNVAWNGSAWDVLGGDIDLSDYALVSYLDDYVQKVESKGLSENDFTSALLIKLNGIELNAKNVTSSTVSGWGYTKMTSENVSSIASGILPAGIMTSSVFASSDGVVKSAVNATNAVNAQTAANVNDKKVTIQLNSTYVDSFTLNQNSDKVVNITGVVVSADIANFVSDDLTVNGKEIEENEITLYGSDIYVSNGGDTLTQVIDAITTSISNINTNIEALGIGDMTIDSFVNGNGVVKSAVSASMDDAGNVIATTYQTKIDSNHKLDGSLVGVVDSAGNATTVNGHTVSKNVPSDAVFTDTIPGSATITISGVDSALGSFTADAKSPVTVSIPQATSSVYGLAKVETVVSNTSNAVANKVVYSLSGIVSNVSSSVNVLTQTIGTLGTSYATAEYVSSAIASKVDIVDLSHVAFTGSYEDLTDKPTAVLGGCNWHAMTIPNTSSSYSLVVNVQKKVGGTWSAIDITSRAKYWTGTDFTALTVAGLPGTLAGYKVFVKLGDVVDRDTECRYNWHIVGHGSNEDSDWLGFIW